MRTNGLTLVTSALVTLQGLAVVGLAVWQIVALVSGDTDSVESAVALILLTLIGGVAVTAFGVAIARGRSWGRSGGIVTQVLILAVALGAATGAYAAPSLALGIAAPALIVFLLLVADSRRAGREASTDATEAPEV
jgi:hypothetical protein